MFLRGKPVKPTVSIPVDDNGAITVLDISTDLIMNFVNGLTPDGYLKFKVADSGAIMIDGKQINQHNAYSSETGALLNLLHSRRGTKVTYDENYVIKDGVRQYIPAGDGEIDYSSVLPRVLSRCPQDVIVSVETHAPREEKISASRSSLMYLTDLLNKYQKGEDYVGTN